MGGRRESTTTVCDDCNNDVSDIEGEACLRLAPIGAFRGARRGDRTYIAAKVEYRGSKWHVENARMDEMAKPPRQRGRIHPMGSRRQDQIATTAKALVQRGLPAEAMLDGRFKLEADADIPPVEPVQTESVEGRLLWGDRITKRVMIKIAIELLALVDADAARSSALERARLFARYNEGHDMDFPASPDTETEGANLSHVKATWFHGMDVWTSGRKVHYRITLFSEIRWVGTLTECWTGPAFSASHTFDVTDPAEQTLDHEPRDGATLVNKSRRLRRHELEAATARAEATNFETAERRVGRAPKPDFNDLYPDVKAWMEKMAKRRKRPPGG